MEVGKCQLRGEESLSIVHRGRWVWKTYKPLDPTGRWPSALVWRAQLEMRAEVSRKCPLINPVRRWFWQPRVAVSLWLDAVRPTTDEDVAIMKLAAPKWLHDIKADNIIVTESGPVLIDFCVNRV